MLNVGFREAIEEIMSLTPPEKRVLLFSATMPKDILRIAEKYMGPYDLISVAKADSAKANIEE
jgi:ATP-dependent RNA helicase DeaD